MDQLAVVLFDEVLRGRLVDHREQLLLARERRAAMDAGGHPVAEHDQEVGERAEEHARTAHDRRGAAQQTAGVLTPHGAGARADEHERDRRHEDGRREQRPPDVVEDDRERRGDEHGRGRLGEDADEHDRVAVRLGVGGDALERLAAPPRRGCQVVQVGARGHSEGGVEGGHEPPEGDEQPRRDQ